MVLGFLASVLFLDLSIDFLAVTQPVNLTAQSLLFTVKTEQTVKLLSGRPPIMQLLPLRNLSSESVVTLGLPESEPTFTQPSAAHVQAATFNVKSM